MGLIHIYCGDGKGKTTAAFGLALRAAGSGMKVHIVQLMKGNETSELNSLEKLDGITLSRCDKNYGFTFRMTEQERNEITLCHNRLLNEAYDLMQSGSIDMLIIDEFDPAYHHGLLEKKLAEKLDFEKPEKIELILTGRYPDEKFLECADYVSEIKSVKHPFLSGIKARKGIEF